jgi:hypothetical protein
LSDGSDSIQQDLGVSGSGSDDGVTEPECREVLTDMADRDLLSDDFLATLPPDNLSALLEVCMEHLVWCLPESTSGRCQSIPGSRVTCTDPDKEARIQIWVPDVSDYSLVAQGVFRLINLVYGYDLPSPYETCTSSPSHQMNKTYPTSCVEPDLNQEGSGLALCQ